MGLAQGKAQGFIYLKGYKNKAICMFHIKYCDGITVCEIQWERNIVKHLGEFKNLYYFVLFLREKQSFWGIMGILIATMLR